MPRYRKEQHYNITLPPFFDIEKSPIRARMRLSGSDHRILQYHCTLIKRTCQGHVLDIIARNRHIYATNQRQKAKQKNHFPLHEYLGGWFVCQRSIFLPNLRMKHAHRRCIYRKVNHIGAASDRSLNHYNRFHRYEACC